MKSLRTLALLAAAHAIFPAAAQPVGEWTLPTVRTKYQNATVYIEAVRNDGRVLTSGTGVVVSDAGHILTARHVLKCFECDTATFWGSIGRRDGGERIALKVHNDEDDVFDLALLQFTMQRQWTKAPIGKPVEPGRTLFVLGFPGTSDLTGFEGQLGNDTQPGGRWHTNLAITNGNSGGPVFDENGSLVAIALRGRPGEEGMKTVAPISHAKQLLRIANVMIAGSSAMPAAKVISVYIDDSQLSGPEAAVDALKIFVRGLGGKIRLAASRSDATYTLTLLNLATHGLDGLGLRATYGTAGAPEPQEEVTGKCLDFNCDKEKSGPERVLADLLHKTLLHPVRGPYGSMKIESCRRASDSGYMFLHVRWQAGPGPDDRLMYEVGEVKDGAAPSPTGFYVDLDELETRLPSEAKARFRALPSNSPYTVRACAEGERAGGEVLMVRVMQRLRLETAHNANLRSLAR